MTRCTTTPPNTEATRYSKETQRLEQPMTPYSQKELIARHRSRGKLFCKVGSLAGLALTALTQASISLPRIAGPGPGDVCT
jgi:hypothetical protein